MQNKNYRNNRYGKNQNSRKGYRNNGRGRRWIIKIGGVSCSVSDTEGAIIIWGEREWQGKQIRIEPRYSSDGCKSKVATFGFYGTGRCHARFDVVHEGEYYTIGGNIHGFYWTEISVESGRVTQIEK